jgi:hypothetical protein
MLVLMTPVEVGRTIRFKVTTESQPVEFINVSRCEPAVFKFMPLNKYVSFEQILALMVPIDVGRTIRFKVTTESQPAELVKVSRYEPAVFKFTPLNKYVSFEQMFALITPVDVARTIRFKVTTESQPVEFINVSRYELVVFKFIPLNKYISFEQMLALMTPVDVGRTIRFKVATESQPAELVKVSM